MENNVFLYLSTKSNSYCWCVRTKVSSQMFLRGCSTLKTQDPQTLPRPLKPNRNGKLSKDRYISDDIYCENMICQILYIRTMLYNWTRKRGNFYVSRFALYLFIFRLFFFFFCLEKNAFWRFSHFFILLHSIYYRIFISFLYFVLRQCIWRLKYSSIHETFLGHLS